MIKRRVSSLVGCTQSSLSINCSFIGYLRGSRVCITYAQHGMAGIRAGWTVPCDVKLRRKILVHYNLPSNIEISLSLSYAILLVIKYLDFMETFQFASYVPSRKMGYFVMWSYATHRSIMLYSWGLSQENAQTYRAHSTSSLEAGFMTTYSKSWKICVQNIWFTRSSYVLMRCWFRLYFCRKMLNLVDWSENRKRVASWLFSKSTNTRWNRMIAVRWIRLNFGLKRITGHKLLINSKCQGANRK